MPCWHVGPCGVGCDGYTANPAPPPMQGAPIIILPPQTPLMSFEVREMIERLQRDIMLLQQQKEAQYQELHEKLSRAEKFADGQADCLRRVIGEREDLKLQNQDLKNSVTLLRLALVRYGQHDEGCDNGTMDRCNCGVQEILKRYEDTVKPDPEDRAILMKCEDCGEEHHRTFMPHHKFNCSKNPRCEFCEMGWPLGRDGVTHQGPTDSNLSHPCRVRPNDEPDGHGNMFCRRHRSHYGIGDRCCHCAAECAVKAKQEGA